MILSLKKVKKGAIAKRRREQKRSSSEKGAITKKVAKKVSDSKNWGRYQKWDR